jgi:hypothetical protein
VEKGGGVRAGEVQEAANRITRRGCRHCDGETSCPGRGVTGRERFEGEHPLFVWTGATATGVDAGRQKKWLS